MTRSRVGIVGLGAWGTALAALLARAGHQVCAWTTEAPVLDELRANHTNSKYLPGISLPDSLRATEDAATALAGADFLVWAIPVQVLREVTSRLAPHVAPESVQVSVAKGLELGTHERPSRILQSCLPGRRLAALLGPSHAEEVARGVPTSVAACAEDGDAAEAVQRLFHGDRFRVYTNSDLAGAEYATAHKNEIALAAGIGDGLGFGDNTKGALMARGLAEMSRLGVALGGRQETFFGLTGLGDLVTTSFSRHSRNRHVGEQIGRGRDLQAVLCEMTQVAEGVATSRAALELARSRRVDVPIIEQVVAILHEGKPPRDALLDLLTRDPRPE
jgi:glycerol-3-phosphate dehydrogenase (NAD(P)+)